MDPKLSDRLPFIIVFIIGIILVIDLVNVFIIGGPSFFSLLFRSGNAVPASATLPPTPATGDPSTVNGTAGAAAALAATTPPGPAIYVPPAATPVPVVSYISIVTPIVTAAADQSISRVLPTATVTRENDAYVYIYSGNLSYLSGGSPTAMALDVNEPPLVINYRVFPVNVTDSKVVVNSSRKKELRTDIIVNSTNPSPDASFTITVFDRDSGQKISQDGYGYLYGNVPEKTFVIRKAGKFIVQFEGFLTEAHVDMLLKREGNIV